ncbi:MAG: carbohydrate ABC transporter permease, partial [Anaerolineae bacterium]|nr:carbohydrate ABC transporter permease [Anaerolineae bacterium]
MLIISLFPVYWIIITSFKANSEIFSLVPSMFPQQPTLDGYNELLNNSDFLYWLEHSAVISLVVASVSVAFSAVAAYGLARFRFRGRGAIGVLILIAYLMPPTLLFIPLYSMVTSLGLSGSLLSLMLIYPTLTVPYATWVLTTYFRGLSPEFEEAAIVDGCSRLQSFWRITVPLASPGIVSTFIFSFTLCWSEYLYALVIADRSTLTVPVGLSSFIVADVFRWNVIMAGAVITSIPIIVLYTLASKYIVSGLTLGGLKG